MSQKPNLPSGRHLLQSWVDGSFLGWLYYSRVENPGTLLILGVSSGTDTGVKFIIIIIIIIIIYSFIKMQYIK